MLSHFFGLFVVVSGLYWFFSVYSGLHIYCRPGYLTIIFALCGAKHCRENKGCFNVHLWDEKIGGLGLQLYGDNGVEFD
mgnify:CR=1 FL=1